MDAKAVFDVLNGHKEHYRVLPLSALTAINGLMSELEAEIDAEAQERAKPRPKKKRNRIAR